MGAPQTILAADGFALAATVFPPAGGRPPRPAVVVNSATGVRRRYYEPFAEYLADDGCPVVTYDYRGIGESRPRSLRGFAATMTQWGEVDQAGVLAWAGDRFAGRPLAIVGHSVGGQILGLAPDPGRVSALLAIGAQHPFWGQWPAPRKYLLAALWHLIMPGVTGACGYFPAHRLGLGEPLPRDVALEWARWCRHPDALFQTRTTERRAAYDAFRGRVHALSFEDDVFAPRRAAERLLEFYGGAERSHRHILPRDAGMRTIGHFGFFRERSRDALWGLARDFLRDIRSV